MTGAASWNKDKITFATSLEVLEYAVDRELREIPSSLARTIRAELLKNFLADLTGYSQSNPKQHFRKFVSIKTQVRLIIDKPIFTPAFLAANEQIKKKFNLEDLTKLLDAVKESLDSKDNPQNQKPLHAILIENLKQECIRLFSKHPNTFRKNIATILKEINELAVKEQNEEAFRAHYFILQAKLNDIFSNKRQENIATLAKQAEEYAEKYSKLWEKELNEDKENIDPNNNIEKYKTLLIKCHLFTTKDLEQCDSIENLYLSLQTKMNSTQSSYANHIKLNEILFARALCAKFLVLMHQQESVSFEKKDIDQYQQLKQRMNQAEGSLAVKLAVPEFIINAHNEIGKESNQLKNDNLNILNQHIGNVNYRKEQDRDSVRELQISLPIAFDTAETFVANEERLFISVTAFDKGVDEERATLTKKVTAKITDVIAEVDLDLTKHDTQPIWDHIKSTIKNNIEKIQTKKIYTKDPVLGGMVLPRLLALQAKIIKPDHGGLTLAQLQAEIACIASLLLPTNSDQAEWQTKKNRGFTRDKVKCAVLQKALQVSLVGAFSGIDKQAKEKTLMTYEQSLLRTQAGICKVANDKIANLNFTEEELKEGFAKSQNCLEQQQELLNIENESRAQWDQMLKDRGVIQRKWHDLTGKQSNQQLKDLVVLVGKQLKTIDPYSQEALPNWKFVASEYFLNQVFKLNIAAGQSVNQADLIEQAKVIYNLCDAQFVENSIASIFIEADFSSENSLENILNSFSKKLGIVQSVMERLNAKQQTALRKKEDEQTSKLSKQKVYAHATELTARLEQSTSQEVKRRSGSTSSIASSSNSARSGSAQSKLDHNENTPSEDLLEKISILKLSAEDKAARLSIAKQVLNYYLRKYNENKLDYTNIAIAVWFLKQLTANDSSTIDMLAAQAVQLKVQNPDGQVKHGPSKASELYKVLYSIPGMIAVKEHVNETSIVAAEYQIIDHAVLLDMFASKHKENLNKNTADYHEALKRLNNKKESIFNLLKAKMSSEKSGVALRVVELLLIYLESRKKETSTNAAKNRDIVYKALYQILTGVDVSATIAQAVNANPPGTNLKMILLDLQKALGISNINAMPELDASKLSEFKEVLNQFLNVEYNSSVDKAELAKVLGIAITSPSPDLNSSENRSSSGDGGTASSSGHNSFQEISFLTRASSTQSLSDGDHQLLTSNNMMSIKGLDETKQPVTMQQEVSGGEGKPVRPIPAVTPKKNTSAEKAGSPQQLSNSPYEREAVRRTLERQRQERAAAARRSLNPEFARKKAEILAFLAPISSSHGELAMGMALEDKTNRMIENRSVDIIDLDTEAKRAKKFEEYSKKLRDYIATLNEEELKYIKECLIEKTRILMSYYLAHCVVLSQYYKKVNPEKLERLLWRYGLLDTLYNLFSEVFKEDKQFLENAFGKEIPGLIAEEKKTGKMSHTVVKFFDNKGAAQTHQDGPHGELCRKLYFNEPLENRLMYRFLDWVSLCNSSLDQELCEKYKISRKLLTKDKMNQVDYSDLFNLLFNNPSFASQIEDLPFLSRLTAELKITLQFATSLQHDKTRVLVDKDQYIINVALADPATLRTEMESDFLYNYNYRISCSASK